MNNKQEEVRQMILEMDKLKTKLEAKLKDAGRYYNKLKNAYDAAVNELTVIVPKLDQSKRDLIRGILTVLGLLATPLAPGASLGTVAGTRLFGASGLVTVGVTVGNSIQNLNFSEVKELLGAFERYKSQLCKELDRVFEVSKIINEKRNLEQYRVIFEIMFPENTVQYKILNVHYKNPHLLAKFHKLWSEGGATNIANGICVLVNLLEELSVQGARLTKSTVAKLLIALGSTFVIDSIMELVEEKKLNLGELVALMQEMIKKEMEDIDDIRSELNYFSF